MIPDADPESAGMTPEIGQKEGRIVRRRGNPLARRRKAAAALLLFAGAVLTIGGLRITAARSARSAALSLGSPLPPVSLANAVGQAVNLRDVAPGRRRVVVFYSPTCGRCERELPAIQPFPAGLDVVAISEDDVPRPSFFSTSDGPQWHLLDPRGSFRRLLPTTGLPTVLLVDGAGIIRDASVGIPSHSGFRDRLQKFGEGAP